MATILGTVFDDILDGTETADGFVLDLGNDSARGGGGDDLMNGDGGDDHLSGQDGDDRLNGGPGNDRLNGGAGADTMNGGTGNDLFNFVDASDILTEGSGQGTDTVRTVLNNYTLLANFENLYLLSAGHSTGIGNDLNNAIFSYGGNDILSGLGGADVIYGGIGNDVIDGGDGNDTIFAQSGNDQILGGAGVDSIDGNEGSDIINGDDGDDALFGSHGRDTINGGVGNDTIFGGTQRDVLTGGLGRDLFVFRPGDYAGLGRTGADSILDFSQTDNDRVRIDGFGSLTFFIGNAAFSGTAGEIRYAHVQGDTMIYGDIDGDGAADLAIHLVGTFTLTADDVVLGN